MKQHPTKPHIKVALNGNIYFQGEEVKPRPNSKSGTLVVYINRNYYSAAKIILETYDPKPNDSKHSYAKSKDGSLKPDQLYWSTNNLNKKEQFKRDCHLSNLGKTAIYSIHYRIKNKGRSLALLAKEYEVSPMSIKRAVERLERKLV